MTCLGLELPSALFEAIAAAVPQVIGTAAPEDLAHLAWALSSLHIAATDLFDLIAVHALKQLDAFAAQDHAVLAWAFASAGVAAADLFKGIAVTVVKTGLSAFAPEHVANLTWAFAVTGFRDAALFQAVSKHATPAALAHFSNQHLANVAFAFASLNLLDAGIFQRLSVEASKHRSETFMQPNDVAQLAWALAVLYKQPAEDEQNGFSTQAFVALCQSLLKRAFEDDDMFRGMGVDDMCQLHQLVLFLNHDAKLAHMVQVQALKNLTAATLVRMRDAFAADDRPRPSFSQQRVAAALQRIGWTCATDLVTDEGLYLDMADAENRKVVLFDGPPCFVTDVDRTVTAYDGRAALKHRLLTALGWSVVHVPFFEWDALEQSSQAEDAYLSNRFVVVDGAQHDASALPVVGTGAKILDADHFKGPKSMPPAAKVTAYKAPCSKKFQRERKRPSPNSVAARKMLAAEPTLPAIQQDASSTPVLTPLPYPYAVQPQYAPYGAPLMHAYGGQMAYAQPGFPQQMPMPQQMMPMRATPDGVPIMQPMRSPDYLDPRLQPRYYAPQGYAPQYAPQGYAPPRDARADYYRQPDYRSPDPHYRSPETDRSRSPPRRRHDDYDQALYPYARPEYRPEYRPEAFAQRPEYYDDRYAPPPRRMSEDDAYARVSLAYDDRYPPQPRQSYYNEDRFAESDRRALDDRRASDDRRARYYEDQAYLEQQCDPCLRR
ncbi:hypothetical protein M885DRAFT_50508 [Pelagophyceae sp. CCMP2097]|nr:hypothetical protein M885DRAFT_50508 [Pelagophyceae sp. CCMP2097]